MINFLLGAPGGGKSYEAVAFHVLPALKKGRKVITNLPLNLAHFELVNPEYLGLIRLVHPSKDNPIPFSTMADYGDPWRYDGDDEGRVGQGPLYVIDECHKALPKGSTNLQVEHWYAEHRHEGADVLLITQSYGKVSQAIRDLCQLCYRVRKLTALGMQNRYARKVQDGLRGEVVNEEVRAYDPAYFPFYKSHTKTGSAVMEAYASDIRPFWRHWSVIGAAIFLGAGLVMGLMGKLNPMPNIETHSPASKSKPPGAAPASPATPRPTAVQSVAHQVGKERIPEHPFYKVDLHIAGYMQDVKGRFLYALAASQNGQNVFEVTSNELAQAGYSIRAISPCSLQISFKDYSDYLTCDAPQTGARVAKLMR